MIHLAKSETLGIDIATNYLSAQSNLEQHGYLTDSICAHLMGDLFCSFEAHLLVRAWARSLRPNFACGILIEIQRSGEGAQEKFPIGPRVNIVRFHNVVTSEALPYYCSLSDQKLFIGAVAFFSPTHEGRETPRQNRVKI